MGFNFSLYRSNIGQTLHEAEIKRYRFCENRLVVEHVPLRGIRTTPRYVIVIISVNIINLQCKREIMSRFQSDYRRGFCIDDRLCWTH